MSVAESVWTSPPGQRLLRQAAEAAEADRLVRRAELLAQRAALVAEHEKRAGELAEAMKAADSKAAKATATAAAAQGASTAARAAAFVEGNTTEIRLAEIDVELRELAPPEIGRCLGELSDLERQTLATSVCEERADEPPENLFSTMGRFIGVKAAMKIRVKSNGPSVAARLHAIREAKKRVASLAMEETPDLPRVLSEIVASIPDGRAMVETFSWSPK